MLLQELKGKNIAVWGLGREGMSNIELILKHRLAAALYAYSDEICSPPAAYPQVRLFCGDEFEQMLDKVDIIIKSPGVSIYKEEVCRAKARGIRFTTSSDIFLNEIRQNHPETTIIGVTGSKGKSTTSSLLYTALKALGQDVALCGNIGRPLVDLIDESHRFVVCELSSYQCSDLSVSPQVVLFTNLFPEHVDWHLSHDNYYRDKVHLIAHQQPDDVCFVNARCDKLKKYCGAYQRRFCYYNRAEGFAELNNVLCRNGEPLLHIEETLLQGYHNLDNMAGVLSVIDYLGLDVSTALESFKTFHALPHRLQKIGEKDGITFINDSISTAPETAIAAIRSFDLPMGIFLGGYDRKQDYHELARIINDTPQVKVVAVLFQTGPRIAETLKQVLTRRDIVLIEEPDFASAVKKVFASLKRCGGRLALFSPAAPSYDAYKSFEVRGEEFIKIFHNL